METKAGGPTKIEMDLSKEGQIYTFEDAAEAAKANAKSVEEDNAAAQEEESPPEEEPELIIEQDFMAEKQEWATVSEPAWSPQTKPFFAPSRTTMFITTIVLILPVLVILVAFTFGGFLAAIESWSWMDGFYYVVGNLCQVTTPLVPVSPESTFGRFVEIIIAVWSLSVSAMFIGFVARFTLVGNVADSLEGAGETVVKELNVDELLIALNRVDSLDLPEFFRIMYSIGFQGPPRQAKELFNKFDLDADGILDREEISAIKEMYKTNINICEKTALAFNKAQNWQLVQNQMNLQRQLSGMEARMGSLEKLMAQMHLVICNDGSYDSLSAQSKLNSKPNTSKSGKGPVSVTPRYVTAM